MRKPLLLLLMPAGLLLSQTPAPKVPIPPAAKPGAKPAVVIAKPVVADPVVFKVGNESMTKSQFDRFVTLMPENLRRQFEGQGKRQVAEQLSELKALAQEAKRLGIDQKPEVQQQIRIQTENVLASQVFQRLMEDAKKNEPALKQYYDSHAAEFEQAKARHILIRFQGSRVPVKEGQKDLTEPEALAKAKAIRERLVKGEDFAAVAKAESDDAGSGANGGDLGEFGHGAMVAEFEQAAFKQPLNEISEPVRSMFGFHIIQVQQRGAQPFAKVRPAIELKVAQPEAQKALQALKQKTVIVLDDGYFGKK